MKDRTSRIWVIGYWILSFALMVGTWKMLMANNTELVHYPQYFPEGLALAALTSSPAVHCPMTSTILTCSAT
jgi:hypothetical protein